MTRVVLTRLVWAAALLLIVTALTFILLSLTPGDAARTILGPYATQAQYEHLRHQLGLNEPLYSQYWHWLRNVLNGNLGSSAVTGQSVTAELDPRVPVTLSLMLGGTLVAALIGIASGIASALSKREWTRGALDVASLVGWATPNFWVALVLVAVFAVAWPLFPATGYVALTSSPFEWLHSLVLPVAALGVGGAAIVAKQTRDAILEAVNQDYVRTLRAAGIPERSVIFRHVFRNAAIPVASVIGILLVGMLGGTVLVEAAFVLPGLGGAAVQATTQHDIPVVQGVALYFTLGVVAINLLVDLSYGWLNPRVRVR